MPAASAAAFSAAAAAQPQIVKSQDCAATPSTLLCSTLLPEHGPHTSCLTHNIAGCVCRASLGTLGAVLLTGYCAASWHASTLSVRHQNSAWDDQWAAANPPFFRSPRILPDALASSNTVITELAVSVRPPSGLLTTALPCTGNKVLQLLLSCSIIPIPLSHNDRLPESATPWQCKYQVSACQSTWPASGGWATRRSTISVTEECEGAKGVHLEAPQVHQLLQLRD